MANNSVVTNPINQSNSVAAVLPSSNSIYSDYWHLRGWVCQKLPTKEPLLMLSLDQVAEVH